MELRYLCPNCRQTLTTDSVMSGSSMRCPNCRCKHVIPKNSTVSKLSLRGEFEAATPVPTTAATGDRISIECDHCHRQFHVRSTKRGALVTCPKCGEKVCVDGAPAGDASRNAAASALQTQFDVNSRPAAVVDAAPPPLEGVFEILEIAPDFRSERGDDVARREPAQQEHTEREAREREPQEYAKRETAERERAQQEQAQQAAREREAQQRAERERQRQEQAERAAKEQARREAEEQELARLEQVEKEARASEAHERQQKLIAERRQAEIAKQQQEAERQADARRQQEELHQAEEQLRLAEQAKLQSQIEHKRQAAEERRRQEAQEQAIREATWKQEEQRRLQRWQTIPARAKQIAGGWAFLQSLPRQQRFEFLDQRRTSLNHWQYCTGSESDVEAAFRGFVELEQQRWVCDRSEIEVHAAAPLAQKYVSPLRNRLGVDLHRVFATPVGGKPLRISFPVAIVAASPARPCSVDHTAWNTGLEFLLPARIRAKMLADSSTNNPVQKAAASLFWFLLPQEAINLLRAPGDIATTEVLSILTALSAGDPGDFAEFQTFIRHALAVYWLNVAALREAAFVAGFCNDAVDYWDIALEYWRRVLEDDAFWQSAGTALKLAVETLDVIRADVPWLLSAIVLHVARAYGRCGDSVSAERLIGAVRRSRLPEPVRDAGAFAVVQGSFH